MHTHASWNIAPGREISSPSPHLCPHPPTHPALPVRPRPHCTSSNTSSAPASSHSCRRPCRNAATAGVQPPSPCTGSTNTAAVLPFLMAWEWVGGAGSNRTIRQHTQMTVSTQTGYRLRVCSHPHPAPTPQTQPLACPSLWPVCVEEHKCIRNTKMCGGDGG